MNRAELQKLARIRLRESRVLFRANEYNGAYYLAGYAIECALKACIAKSMRRYEFPDKDRVNKSYVHRAINLMQVANLEAVFLAATRTNPRLQASWDVVSNWSEQARYQSERRNGVLSWLKLHW